MNSCVTLFLDFDGVTHPEPCGSESAFCSLNLIEAVLLDYPSVEIVVSSSWRDHYSLADLQEFFSDAIKARVIDVTPSVKRPSADWLPAQVPRFDRQWECESWLKLNRPWASPWLAIDDRAYWFEPDCRHLLLTQSKLGFTQPDQERLRHMIEERL